MKRILLAAIFCCSLAAKAQSICATQRYLDSVFDYTVTPNLLFATATPYGALAQPQDLYMDVYEPVGDTLAHRPLIVFQFGGGFLIGWRSQPPIPAFCEWFAKQGYVVAAIDYRIGFNTVSTGSAERAVVRAVQDQRAALRYLAQRAEQFHIDTNAVIATGTSAGCFAGLGSAFMLESQIPQSANGILLEPEDLGGIDSSGNNDFGNRNVRLRAIINQWGAILDTAFITTAPEDNVPVISFHGTNDNAVPYVYGYPFSYPVFPNVYGSQPIHERLDAMGILNVLHPLDGYGHEPELLNPDLNDTIRQYSRAFLYEVLKPQTDNISGPSQLCATRSATFSVTNNSGSRYCWEVDGSPVNTATSSITLSFADTGIHLITLREKNYLDYVGDEESFTVHVVPDVQAQFGFVVNELHIDLLNISAGATNFVWDFGDGNTAASQNAANDFASPGTYDVWLIADNTVCSDSLLQTFTVDTCPAAMFTFTLTNYNCFLNAQLTNTTTYYWNFGDGDSAAVSAANVFHQYAQDGSYIVTLRVINELGCEEIFSDTIVISTSAIAETASDEVRVKQLSNGWQLEVSEAFLGAHYTLSDVLGRITQQGILRSRITNLESDISNILFLQLSKGGRLLNLKLQTSNY